MSPFSALVFVVIYLIKKKKYIWQHYQFKKPYDLQEH